MNTRHDRAALVDLLYSKPEHFIQVGVIVAEGTA
jgi:hypothetical protein